MHRLETRSPKLVGSKWGDCLTVDDFDASISKTERDKQPGAAMTPDPPPTRASLTATLRKISVHFDIKDNDETQVVGFTMKFSDGVEIQTSRGQRSLQGTKQIQLLLVPNEHFVVMVVRGTWTHEVKFLTTSNRWLRATVGKQPSWIISDEETQRFITPRIQSRQVISFVSYGKDGNILFETVPLARFAKKTNAESTSPPVNATIPTLAILTYEAATSNFKNEAMRIEQDRTALQETLRDKFNAKKRFINQQYEQMLQSSNEAALYRMLISLVSKAKEKLDARAMKELMVTVDVALKSFHQTELENDESRCKYANKHLVIFDEHQQFLNMRADLSVNVTTAPITTANATTTSHRETLCFAPNCRKLYQYNKVAKHLRCTVPGCTVNFPSCGCSVTECTDCHEILCNLHLQCHDRAEYL